MKKTSKLVAKFSSVDKECRFWATHSALDYFDISRAKRASFPNLKPSVQSISTRLPADMLEALKVLANRRDVPYQSLLKIFLAERIKVELQTPVKA